MKNIKRLLTLMVCFAVVIGTMATSPASVFAADDNYKYSVTVNSGKEGTFSKGDTNTIKTYKNIANGGSVTISEEDLGLKVKDDSTYYVRGLKISGHDNDETSVRHYQFPVTLNNVTEDMSFSVAYGVKGSMIDYTVRYVMADDHSEELRQARTYYGMPGDYLVVSAEYIEDFVPDAYSKGWTLREDGIREIVFYMTYAPQGADNGNQDNAANNGNNANNANGGAANAGANDGQPANFVNLDDGQTPTTNPEDVEDGSTDIQDENPPASLIDRVGLMPFILGGGLLAALIALIAFLRARGRDDDDDDADELEEMLDDPDIADKLADADPEKFNTNDPDKLKEAFKEVGKKDR